MSKKRILSVACEIPGGFSEYVEFESCTSLLDGDIIIIYLNIEYLIISNSSYQGKPSLSERRSFHIRECTAHWRREIQDALDSGKNVFVFLYEKQDFFIDSGNRNYSGTGKNRHKTILVTQYDNYKCLPFDLGPVNSNGSAMKLAKDCELLKSYWTEFGYKSTYKVRIEGNHTSPLVLTKTGDKVVGAKLTSKESKGSLIALPYLDFNSEEFLIEDDDEELIWTKEGEIFGNLLVNEIIKIDKTLKKGSNITPAPEWIKSSKYELPKESTILQELLRIEEDIELLNNKKQSNKEQLESERTLKNLLFEKGRPLESAILNALELIGFKADSYKDGESEFDAVFESKEGRFLGEAEGKDNSSIGIDKLRQLEMNILEDLDREDVNEPALGVIFGNAFRLKPLEERDNYFTNKCHSAVKRSGTILIQTPDLFKVAKYLSDNKNSEYAKKCRIAILESKCNIVSFPDPPDTQ